MDFEKYSDLKLVCEEDQYFNFDVSSTNTKNGIILCCSLAWRNSSTSCLISSAQYLRPLLVCDGKEQNRFHYRFNFLSMPARLFAADMLEFFLT
jgi:hypothetical protein